MKKNVLLAFVLMLLSTAVVMEFIRPVVAQGTIYIRANGSVDPPTANITSVDNVTYTFTDNIIDSIVVQKDNIVVDGARYTLQGPGSGSGIDLSERSNVTIKNTEIKAFGCGIYLWKSSNNTISGNNITDNSDGILLDGYSNNNTISGNNIRENSDGILLDDSSNNNSVYGNNITSSEWNGIWLADSANNNTISGNDIINSKYGIVLVGFSNNNSVSGNSIANNGYGIWLEYSSNNTIYVNNITNNNNGIYLYYSSNNVLRNNNLTGNDYSFGVSGQELSHFVHDVDSSNTVNGKPIYYWVNRQNMEIPPDAGYVALVNSANITIKELELKNNRQGILLANSNNSRITDNNIINSKYGIVLVGFSNNNSVSGNSIANNGYGIWLEYSSNNKFYHNNFVNNTEQVHIETSWYANFWDYGYPSGGNFWSDYAGVDLYSGPNQSETGIDGIGDKPHIIDNNVDHYPLMHPWSYLPVHNINTGLGYASIQEAIKANETLYRHTIFVEAGTYVENVVVNKAISLIGEDRYNTIINGNGTGNVIEVTVGNVNIIGFTIQNSGSTYLESGIYIGGLNTGNNISYNIITDNEAGIHLVESSNNTISGNNIRDNKYGIYVWLSSNNSVHHNNFMDNTKQVNSDNSTNVWDDGYPSGGNYWSDYEVRYPDATEIDDSGIWDTPYVIDEHNQDNYPLMSPLGDVQPPVANAGPDLTVNVGTTVTFDGSKSVDDVAIKSYVWTFTDITPQTLTGIQPNYTFNNVGDFEVTLNVSDHAGNWDTDMVTITVLAQYTLTIYSSPSGVTFAVGDVFRTTLWSGVYVENTSVSLIMSEIHIVGDAKYYWNQWSDGNTSRSRTVIMTTNITLTAYYTGPYHELTVTSSPMTDITFTINGTSQTTPSTEWLLEDSYTLEMPETYDGYVWSRWLEDGDPNRIKTFTMNTNILLTAVFTPPDTIPPTISIISPENKTYTVNNVPLTFTVNELTSWIGYNLDGQMNITIGGNTTLTSLFDGPHYVVVYANDTFGNIGASNTVHFTVDTVSPNIVILSPENKAYATSSVLLSLTVDEAPLWMGYSLDGRANVTITANTTLSELSDGSHSIIVYAKDKAGNIGASEMVYFSIETQQAEPFPMWVISVIVIIAVVGTALLAYFAKVKKTSEKVKR